MSCVVGCSEPALDPPRPKQDPPVEVRTPGPEAAQPPAVSAIAGPGLSTISVTVTPTKLFVRGKPIEPEQLQSRLEALAKHAPHASIAVQADASVPRERMSSVLRTIKTAGFSAVAVATRPVH